MQSKIAKALNLPTEPVGVIWTDEEPEDAQKFQEGKWGCVMWLLAGAAKGRVASFSRETFGCWDSGVRDHPICGGLPDNWDSSLQGGDVREASPKLEYSND